MLESKPVAITVNKVSKNFKLPHEKVSSIKSMFTQGLRKKDASYETQHALKDISFEIKKGEFFGIVGRNGSGKSTLLKILAEIYQPTSGTVAVDGRLVPFIELGVGFNPELTGRENVYLNGALLGFSKEDIEGMYDDIVAFAELEKFMDQKLKNYSSGMQVRLAFSVATRAKADILLVDEVLAVGDADFQRKCFNYFKRLKKESTTVVFVTHDMGSVREYCDRAILIEKNKLVMFGTGDEIAAAYTKLFQKSSRDNGIETKSDRWGDSEAYIKHVASKHEIYTDKHKTIQFTTVVRSKQAFESLVIGFSLKDSTGRILLGTNTLLCNQRITNIKANEEFSVIWEIPNIFREGEYFLDVAVNHANGIDIHDWWQEASAFSVRSTRYSQYIVNPYIDIEVRR